MRFSMARLDFAPARERCASHPPPARAPARRPTAGSEGEGEGPVRGCSRSKFTDTASLLASTSSLSALYAYVSRVPSLCTTASTRRRTIGGGRGAMGSRRRLPSVDLARLSGYGIRTLPIDPQPNAALRRDR